MYFPKTTGILSTKYQETEKKTVAIPPQPEALLHCSPLIHLFKARKAHGGRSEIIPVFLTYRFWLIFSGYFNVFFSLNPGWFKPWPFLGWWSVTSLGGLHLGRVYFQQSKTPPERTPKINLTRHPQMANKKSCDWRNLSAAKRAAREGKLEVASTKSGPKSVHQSSENPWEKRSGDHIALKQPYGKRTWLENYSPVPTQNTSSNGAMVDPPFVYDWDSTCNFVANAQPPSSCEAFSSTHCSSLLWKRAIPKAHVFLGTTISPLWERI